MCQLSRKLAFRVSKPGPGTESVPTGTPPVIVAKLNAACQKALANPALRQRFSEISVDPAPSTSEEFGAFIKSETNKWRGVITEAGISLQ
jgi:tripartite-type tricarboxylate transporter receptor subunit TctC